MTELQKILNEWKAEAEAAKRDDIALCALRTTVPRLIEALEQLFDKVILSSATERAESIVLEILKGASK